MKTSTILLIAVGAYLLYNATKNKTPTSDDGLRTAILGWINANGTAGDKQTMMNVIAQATSEELRIIYDYVINRVQDPGLADVSTKYNIFT